VQSKPGARVAAVVAGALVFSVASLLPRAAGAFCRTSTCEAGTGALCDPPQPNDCGTALAWEPGCLGYSLQQDGSSLSDITLQQAEAIFAQAFASWTQADCAGGGSPALRVDYQGSVQCGMHEFNQEEGYGNANIIVFKDSGWPHGNDGRVLALTTVTYDLANGKIYDADMELNSEHVVADGAQFTIGDGNVQFDLLSIATHEAGHFLGISHSANNDATMFADYIPGSTDLRSLSDDDIAGICDAYPPGQVASDCDATPHGGLATECDSPPGSSCCTVAPGAPQSGSEALLALALGFMALGARRRDARGG
jgi:hypothetical protein